MTPSTLLSRRCLPALAAAGLTLLAGCSTTFVRRGLERRVQKRLAELLGPAKKYSVRIRGSQDAQLVKGRAAEVDVQGKQILARGQFLIDSLQLTLIDLRYVGAEPYFVSVRRSDLEVEFTDTALNDYLRTYEARYNPEVKFEPGQVRVRIVYPFLGTPVPISAVGQFKIEEGRRLLFDAQSADVSFLNTPGFGEKFVEDRVNPLLDLSRIDFPARLDEVQVLQGRIRAHGSASIPNETPG